MAGTQCFHCHDLGSIPDWGTKILKASLCGPKKKKKKVFAFCFHSRNY